MGRLIVGRRVDRQQTAINASRQSLEVLRHEARARDRSSDAPKGSDLLGEESIKSGMLLRGYLCHIYYP